MAAYTHKCLSRGSLAGLTGPVMTVGVSTQPLSFSPLPEVNRTPMTHTNISIPQDRMTPKRNLLL
jgi:hypothetical protein